MFGCSYYLMQDSFFTTSVTTSFYCIFSDIALLNAANSCNDKVSPRRFGSIPAVSKLFANHAFVWSSLPYECCKLFKAFFFFAEMPLLSIGKMLFRLSLRLPVYLFLSVSKSLNLHLAEGQILFWYDEC